MSELERLRHYYIAAAGGQVPHTFGVHPMQKLVQKPKHIRVPADDEAQVKALLEELNETAFKRHRAHGRRLDLSMAIQRKAQHVAVEAERAILLGYHGREHPFMPHHVRERLDDIQQILVPAAAA